MADSQLYRWVITVSAILKSGNLTQSTVRVAVTNDSLFQKTLIDCYEQFLEACKHTNLASEVSAIVIKSDGTGQVFSEGQIKGIQRLVQDIRNESLVSPESSQYNV